MTALDRSLGTSRRLILTDDVAEQARLESSLGSTQAEVVSEFVERTCWGEDIPHLIGGRGTPAERLAALRAAFSRDNEVAPAARGDRHDDPAA